MSFKTKLDYSNNRQIKQYNLTNTQLSGTTTFGVNDVYIPLNFTGDTINIDALQNIRTRGLILPNELPTTSNNSYQILGRDDLTGKLISITGITASNADTLDNLDSTDFVRSTGTINDTITGIKTFNDNIKMTSDKKLILDTTGYSYIQHRTLAGGDFSEGNNIAYTSMSGKHYFLDDNGELSTILCNNITASSFSGSGSNLLNVNAETLDNLDSVDFVRSTGSVAQTITGNKTFTGNTIIDPLGTTTNIAGSVNTIKKLSSNLSIDVGSFIDINRNNSTSNSEVAESYGQVVRVQSNSNFKDDAVIALNTVARKLGSGTIDGLYANLNASEYNGSGNVGFLIGLVNRVKSLGTGTGTIDYIRGLSSEITINNPNVTINYLQGLHPSLGFGEGAVGEASVLYLDVDPGNAIVTGDLAYIQSGNDVLPIVNGNAYFIKSLTQLPSLFSGNITAPFFIGDGSNLTNLKSSLSIAQINLATGDILVSREWIESKGFGTGSGATNLSELTDVTSSTPTNRNVLIANGTSWVSRALTESDISDLGNYISTIPNASSTVYGAVKLFSNTLQSVVANAVSETASRTYGIQNNSSGQNVVNVPWENTTYSVISDVNLANTTSTTGGLITGEKINTWANSKGLTTTNINNWGTAFGWGNHATQGYLTNTSISNLVTLNTNQEITGIKTFKNYPIFQDLNVLYYSKITGKKTWATLRPPIDYGNNHNYLVFTSSLSNDGVTMSESNSIWFQDDGIVVANDFKLKNGQSMVTSYARHDAVQPYTKQQYFQASPLISGVNININFDNKQVCYVTLNGNSTILNPTNVKDGAMYMVAISQDGAGSRLVSWSSDYEFGDAGPPTLSVAATKTDFLSFIGDNTNRLFFLGITRGFNNYRNNPL